MTIIDLDVDAADGDDVLIPFTSCKVGKKERLTNIFLHGQ